MTTDDTRPLSVADAVDEWLAQTVVPFGNPSIIEYNVRAFASWLDLQQPAERARHAALVEAASAVALDYHTYAIEDDVRHPAVTWDRCTDPKCAALRAALAATPAPALDEERLKRLAENVDLAYGSHCAERHGSPQAGGRCSDCQRFAAIARAYEEADRG
jgi:hypothetical protein